MKGCGVIIQGMNIIVRLLALCLIILAGGCAAGKGYGHKYESHFVGRYVGEPVPGSVQPPVMVPQHFSSTSSRGHYREESWGTVPWVSSGFSFQNGQWVQVAESGSYTYSTKVEVNYPPVPPPIPWGRVR
jgi:hypothetical protein